jgi:mannose-6-phosphate isomerase-like protein (cupin superfamily)
MHAARNSEVIMKNLFWSLSAVLCLMTGAAAWAQDQARINPTDPQPTCTMCPGTYIPAAELEGYAAKALAEKLVDQQVRDVDIGKARIGIGMVHRGKLEKPVPNSVAEHDQISEVYHVISGAATLVLGPDIVNRQRRPATMRTVVEFNGPGNNGSEVRDGIAYEIKAGDVVVIPAGTGHWFTRIEDHIDYLMVRIDPDKVTPLKSEAQSKEYLSKPATRGESWKSGGSCGILPRGDAFLEGVGHLLVNEFEREAFIEVSHYSRLDLAEHDERSKRRTVFRRDGGAGARHVDNPASHLGAVLEREQRDRIARHDTIVAAVFRQIENVAVGKPGQLRCELVALARGRAHGHGKAIVDDAGNLALDPADVVEIGDDAVADIADAGRQQRQSTRRHIDDLARKFAAVRQHITPQQMDLHPLEAPSLLGGRQNRFFVRQSHLRHPTTGISESFDPTASRVNEPLATASRSGIMSISVLPPESE